MTTKNKLCNFSSAIVIANICATSVAAAESLTEFPKIASVSGDFRLRYEDVDLDSVHSDGLTLRSRLKFRTDTYRSTFVVVEIEDVRNVLSINDENDLIPDPEITEIDQAFIQYTGIKFVSKLGRQVIALDGQRFIGHVGWRQDRQTFDAFRTTLSPTAALSFEFIYIYKRNRILAEAADANSNDILFNVSYQTSLGKLVSYAYLLDDEFRDEQSDTFGVSFNGAAGDTIKFRYSLEYASQSIANNDLNYNTDYILAEIGASISDITVKMGYEMLGSDGGMASFTTPLATLHKFNGWNDIFLGGTFNPLKMPDGLKDKYVSLRTTVSGVTITALYHKYYADEKSTSYGDEASFSATKLFGSGFSLQVKYSNYNAADFGENTEKLWLTVGYKF